MLQNIWQLEHGYKLLKCQEKPSGVYKMQENAWNPDPTGGALYGLGLRPFGPRLSPPAWPAV